MIFTKLLLSIALTTFSPFSAWADDTCAECKDKKMQGLPSVPNSAELSAISSVAASDRKPDFYDTTQEYCLKFGQQTANTVGYYLKTELQNAPYYSIEDYFQRAGCRVRGYGGDVKAPLLHMIVDYPESRHDFAEIVYIYYTKRRKNKDLWIKAINAKNTEGETLLDYIEFRLRSGTFHHESTLNAAKSIQKYICENGGVYSKYSDKKCP